MSGKVPPPPSVGPSGAHPERVPDHAMDGVSPMDMRFYDLVNSLGNPGAEALHAVGGAEIAPAVRVAELITDAIGAMPNAQHVIPRYKEEHRRPSRWTGKYSRFLVHQGDEQHPHSVSYVSSYRAPFLSTSRRDNRLLAEHDPRRETRIVRINMGGRHGTDGEYIPGLIDVTVKSYFDALGNKIGDEDKVEFWEAKPADHPHRHTKLAGRIIAMTRGELDWMSVPFGVGDNAGVKRRLEFDPAQREELWANLSAFAGTIEAAGGVGEILEPRSSLDY